MMARGLRFMGGMVLGASLAIGVVLILAPQSGDDLRQGIVDRVNGIMAEGRQAAQDRRLKLMTEFEVKKQPQPRP
jgi:gas vesicle protein